MDWKQLWEILSAADNVPIVAMIPLLAFYMYLAWKQAHANDVLIEQLAGDAALAKTHHRKAWPFDPWIAGVVMPTLIIIGLMVIPYIDTNPLGSGYYTWKQRKFAISTFLFGFVILWVSMIFIGTFIRGPGWQWFWPGQTWDHNRLIYEVNRDLPDLFGITSNWGKGIFGAIVVGGFFVVGGLIVHAFFRRHNPKDYKRMSLLQYSILMTFLLTMLGLPIKMLLRLLFHIKYVWITPWFNV